jgi:SPP1 family predicted phage head-tail adaptor
MRAGRLDRSIIIERKTEAVSDSGAVASSWSVIASPRAEVLQASAAEFLTGMGEEERGTIVFRIRYVAGITTEDRITYSGEAYNLVEIKEIGRRRGLELRCERVRQ